jgi:hypothetical protein
MKRMQLGDQPHLDVEDVEKLPMHDFGVDYAINFP